MVRTAGRRARAAGHRRGRRGAVPVRCRQFGAAAETAIDYEGCLPHR
jgi:hypothetical protein